MTTVPSLDVSDLSAVADESGRLVITSPPYWTFKEYLPHARQLGSIADSEEFLTALDKMRGAKLALVD